MPSLRSIALLPGVSALAGSVFATDISVPAQNYSSGTSRYVSASGTIVPAIYAPSGTIRVGGFYLGRICEIFIYDRALNLAKRSQIHAASANRVPDEDSLTNMQELEQGLRAVWADNPTISIFTPNS